MNKVHNSKLRALRWISALLIMAFVAQPISIALPARAAAPSNPQQGGEKTYVPFIRGGLAEEVEAQEIEISSPKQGSIVAGSFLLSAQPLHSGTVDSVDFSVNNTLLGTDNTPDNGFALLLDSVDLPDGDITLRAVAHGTGEGDAQVTVTNVQNPPQESAAGANGAAVAASQIGSVIMVPPGGLPPGATLKVTEKTQEEVTAENGIDWDGIGVTFLGAQVVETSAPIAKPPAVSSAGFASRVQPGQAVVNYNLLPDANGDGVAEIVVVNTASLAASGNVVSDPLPEVTVGDITVLREDTAGMAQPAQTELRGPPGTILEIDVTGFNIYSFAGNVARYKSEVNGQEFELSGIVTQNPEDLARQYFSTQIPPLPPGPATLTLVNLSTTEATAPIAIIVDPAPALDRPAAEIIDDYFEAAIAFTDAILQSAPPDVDKDAIMLPFTTGREAFQELAQDSSAEAQLYLQQMAQMIIASGALDPEFGLPAATTAAVELFGRCFDPKDDGLFSGRRGYKNLTLGVITIVGIAAILAAATEVGFLAGIILGIGAALLAAVREFLDTNTPDCPPPPCPPSGGGSGTTGMGSATAPGGNGCGNAGGAGAAEIVRGASLSQLEVGRIIVKIFPQAGGRLLTPFTGATDAGGYFFIPLIPANEPFRALATDQLTGASVSFEGIGPAIGESVLMSFDFTNAQENRYNIAIGDTITNGVPGPGAGNIEEAGGLDIYAFNAAAGQRVFFDVLELDINVRWELRDPFGATIFSECLACGDPGAFTLAQAGTYIINVGGDNNGEVGTYQFKLWDVPPAQEFDIAIGDTITNGVPGPGAGNIETPGVLDIYTFDAAAGQRIFIDALELDVNIRWELLDPAGESIFSECLACGDPGTFTLSDTGTYTLTVGSNTDDAAGIYQFKVWDVPDSQEFSIAIGDTVTNGSPGAGAGNIETPGVLDIYTFEAVAGQRIFVDALDLDVNIRWEMTDPAGESIFSTCLACGDPGVFTLAETGTYTLIVGATRDDSVGAYQFKLWDVPPSQEFAITVGDTISNGVPGPGAGNVESPGVLDIYTFNATAGQHVVFDVLDLDVNIRWRLLDPAGEEIFSECLACGDPGEFTLATAGSYTIEVGDNNDDSTGTYSFQLRTP